MTKELKKAAVKVAKAASKNFNSFEMTVKAVQVNFPSITEQELTEVLETIKHAN